MNLGRIGHYHTPSGEGERGSCQLARVIFHSEYDKDPGPPNDAVTVNLIVDAHIGTQSETRLLVPVHEPNTGTGASFHLSGECPWRR